MQLQSTTFHIANEHDLADLQGVFDNISHSPPGRIKLYAEGATWDCGGVVLTECKPWKVLIYFFKETTVCAQQDEITRVVEEITGKVPTWQ